MEKGNHSRQTREDRAFKMNILTIKVSIKQSITGKILTTKPMIMILRGLVNLKIIQLESIAQFIANSYKMRIGKGKWKRMYFDIEVTEG